MAAFAALSTVFSNISTTPVLTPAVLLFARRTGASAIGLLMPLAFASMMGGSMTLIGTSTNISASGMVSSLGLEPNGFFELFAIGWSVLGVDIVLSSVSACGVGGPSPRVGL